MINFFSGVTSMLNINSVSTHVDAKMNGVGDPEWVHGHCRGAVARRII